MLVSATQLPALLASSRAAGSLNFTTSCQLLKTMSSVASCAALADAGLLGAAVEQHAEAARVAVLPFLGAHLAAAEPLIQVTSLTPSSSLYTPERKRLRRRIGYLWRRPVSFCTKRDQRARRRRPTFQSTQRDLVVLAVGVVVALLRAAELVARQQHRRALRQEQRRQHVAHLALAQRR